MDRWIFGYGSLVWRPAFPHLERRAGHIVGWARRFWQKSTDHRGTVEAPGRVATLIPAPGVRCDGMAYRVAAADLGPVLDGLDVREQQGYERHDVEVHLAATDAGPAASVPALIYVAGPGNWAFAGEAPLDQIAAIVRTAHGPSGANVEYVLELARALAAIGARDEHVESLARLVAGAGDGDGARAGAGAGAATR